MYSVPIFKVDNEIIGLKNEDIEDNTAFLKWRINTTYSLTATYASCWKKNLYIKNLSAHARNEIYTERVSYQKMTYNSKKHKYDVDKLRYYVIYSNRYYISITTGK